MSIYREFERLINFGLKNELFEKEDKIFMRNSLIDLFKLDEYIVEEVEDENLENVTPIMENLLNYAYEMGILESNSPVYRDLLDSKIMGILMPRPSQVINNFNMLYAINKKSATDYLYKLGKDSDYIRTSRIAQNMTWKTSTKYGDMDITINLSKPEKDPKAIAAARNVSSSSYPKCLLCKENVGYAGRLNHPARQNLRIIPFKLQGDEWNLQYSPYSYYNEHCIVFSSEHEPMKISKTTLDRNLEFVERFPHYFIGSNADLPIVGGSILTHDHYQGGRHVFPMEKAKIEKYYESDKFKNVEIGTVKWPMTVIRLKSEDKKALVDVAMEIFEAWKVYSDEANDILAFTGETPHNTVTPIARRNNGAFELDIVLRNNRTSEEHPDGIFHPHKELHHIKKENIGLIEVMGLAVLPGRLEKELEKIAEIISGEVSYDREVALEDNDLNKHIDWIEEMLNKNSDMNLEDARNFVKEEVGIIFSKVLEDSGVFKRNKKGQAALEKFITSVI